MIQSESQLLSALELGLNNGDLNRIALNIHSLRKWHSDNREAILDEADREITDKAEKVRKLVLDLCYERQFCIDAGIVYSDVGEEDSRLIKTAIVHYLLTKREHKVYNVRKINCTIYSADSCEQLSDFSEHPENQNKPHLLRCGKLKVFLIYLKV